MKTLENLNINLLFDRTFFTEENYCRLGFKDYTFSDVYEKLLEKPEIILANKMDIETSKENLKDFKEKIKDKKIFEITAITNEGLKPVLTALADMLDTIEKEPLYEETKFESHILYTFDCNKRHKHFFFIKPCVNTDKRLLFFVIKYCQITDCRSNIITDKIICFIMRFTITEHMPVIHFLLS